MKQKRKKEKPEDEDEEGDESEDETPRGAGVRLESQEDFFDPLSRPTSCPGALSEYKEEGKVYATAAWSIIPGKFRLSAAPGGIVRNQRPITHPTFSPSASSSTHSKNFLKTRPPTTSSPSMSASQH